MTMDGDSDSVLDISTILTDNLSTATDDTNNINKKNWTPEEDDMLRELVSIYAGKSGIWTTISAQFGCRSGKQCRERWLNHLHPGIKKGEWTKEEDRIILEMQQKLGNQWAKITKFLPGRTDNSVKNRFHANTRARRQNKLPRGRAIDRDGEDDFVDDDDESSQSMTENIDVSVPGFACDPMSIRHRFGEVKIITKLNGMTIQDKYGMASAVFANPERPYNPHPRIRMAATKLSARMAKEIKPPKHSLQIAKPLVAFPIEARPSVEVASVAAMHPVIKAARKSQVHFRAEPQSLEQIARALRQQKHQTLSQLQKSHQFSNNCQHQFPGQARAIKDNPFPSTVSGPMLNNSGIAVPAIALTMSEEYVDRWLEGDKTVTTTGEEGSQHGEEEEWDCGAYRCEIDPFCRFNPFAWDGMGSKKAAPTRGVSTAIDVDPQCSLLTHVFGSSSPLLKKKKIVRSSLNGTDSPTYSSNSEGEAGFVGVFGKRSQSKLGTSPPAQNSAYSKSICPPLGLW